MSFHNIEGVRKVQEAREQQRRNEDKQLADIFADQVRELFGRNLGFDEMMENREAAGANQPVYRPDPPKEAPQQKSARDRVQENVVLHRKAPKDPADVRTEVDAQEQRKVPTKDK